jgi:hypothetical protein
MTAIAVPHNKSPKKLSSASEENLKLRAEIATMLMDFVCHGQKPFSKKLSAFMKTGMHDIRATDVAADILKKVQEYLDGNE